MKVIGGNGSVEYLIALYENTIDAILLVKFGAKKKQCVEEQRSNKKLGLTWAGRMAGLSGMKSVVSDYVLPSAHVRLGSLLSSSLSLSNASLN